MATLDQKKDAERRMRDLLAENDLPQPDHVEYGFGCVRFFFKDSKHVVVLDIDDYGDISAELDEAPAEPAD